MCVDLQSVTSAFVRGTTPMTARAEPDHEHVVFQFGSGTRRFDLYVRFADLERVATVAVDAIQQRDALLAAEHEASERQAAEQAGVV